MVTQRSLVFVETVTIRASYRAGFLMLMLHMSGNCSFVNPFLTILALHFGTIYNMKYAGSTSDICWDMGTVRNING